MAFLQMIYCLQFSHQNEKTKATNPFIKGSVDKDHDFVDEQEKKKKKEMRRNVIVNKPELILECE